MFESLRLGGVALVLLACSSASSGEGTPNGGADAGGASAGTGGAPSGGSQSGGSGNSGGRGNGGASGDGGLASGGAASGGMAGAAGSGSGGAATGGAGGAGNAGGQWVLGYYAGYQIDDYPIDVIDWSALTHVAFAPLLVNADRSLDFTFDDSHGTGPADARALATAAHQHGVKALMMLGGANAGARIAAAADDAHRAAFVSALITALSDYGYDGIDLDWEDSVNLDDLVSLAKDLRAAKPDIVLSYPGGPINPNIESAVDPRYVDLATALDRYDVQTYYPTMAVAGYGWSSWFLSPLGGSSPVTPIAIDDTLSRLSQAGIPKAKLGMGTAFYAICYTGGITGPRQPTDGTGAQIVGGDNAYPLRAFFASGSTFDLSTAAERKRDTEAAAPYLSLAAPVNDPGCGASTQYVSYEDETSLIAKGTFSKQNGYGGIIVWTIQEGYLNAGASGGRSRNALMEALKRGFLD
ncbi:MAG TPA: glycoside hydrolase family 18 protein [Polyangiaceae bacterium]|nr:glycoside hydrolase family 18 protein [Polyangiaceae bacterium]